MYIASLKRSENYKAQPYQYASTSKQILKVKAKPFLPCIHCSFNDHRHDDCKNYPKCGICGSYDHFTSRHHHVIHIKGGVLAESLSLKYVEQPGPKVVFGDNSSCIIEGYGSINYEDQKKSQAPEMIMSFIKMDHLGKFDAKADDGYFLGYFSISKAFRVYNTRRQLIEETYHLIFDESMESIRFTNTSVDKIGIDDSSRYPSDEFQEEDPSRQYQVDSDVSYYIIPYGRSLTKITQENHVSGVIAPNKPEIPHTEDTEGPRDLINTKGIHEQNVQNDQMITQPTNAPSRNNTEGPGPITKPLSLMSLNLTS
nr:retrovirus-related Pol polyprotein from transposon TNT 1-94 [Tanacetum cinerariifolium]